MPSAQHGEPYARSYLAQWQRRGAGVAVAPLTDPASRLRKAAKILAVLEDFLGRPLSALRCLEVGCSAGLISAALAERFGSVVGVDPDPDAITRAGRLRQPNLHFVRASILDFPGPAESFDVIVCNHVYEHVHDQRALALSIHRLLRRDGCCYFSAGNRLMLVEGHYGLPLLSWPPPAVGSWYLRVAGRGRRYDERHQTLWALRRLLRDFAVHDYTLRVLREPARFAAGELVGPAVSALPGAGLRLLYPLIPTYIWVLTKAQCLTSW
ncbi:MAG: class I SAM-dependent methyltransferase [Chloroflexi bacterium]|nr:class I SAM-dependent methyltransferase [Chloroflexota bacterium]